MREGGSEWVGEKGLAGRRKSGRGEGGREGFWGKGKVRKRCKKVAGGNGEVMRKRKERGCGRKV